MIYFLLSTNLFFYLHLIVVLTVFDVLYFLILLLYFMYTYRLFVWNKYYILLGDHHYQPTSQYPHYPVVN